MDSMIRIVPKSGEKDKFETEYVDKVKAQDKKRVKINPKKYVVFSLSKVNKEIESLNIHFTDQHKKKQQLKKLEDLVILDFQNLKSIKEQLDKIPISKSYWKKNYKQINLLQFLYENFRKSISNNAYMSSRIVDYFDMRTCPYCNNAYISNRILNNSTRKTKLQSTTAQLDHFYAKDNYPIFALCLYNFVPSCPTCNQKKSSNQLKNSPHDETVSFEEKVHFTYELKEEFYCQEGIEVKFRDDIDKDIWDDMNLLEIEPLYATHNDVVWELIEKTRWYNEYKIRELIEDLGLYDSEEEVYRMLYGGYMEEENFLKRPLSKLTHDIVTELKGW